MREFWIEQVAPAGFVCALVLGLTLLLFGVPSGPPLVTRVARTAALGATPPQEGAPTPAPSVRPEVSEVMARAMRTLELARGPDPRSAPRTPPPAVPLTGPGAPGVGAVAPRAGEAPAPSEPALLDAVSALGNAIKAVHEVRTEQDLVTAEARLREARVQMQATCKAGGGPLCDGARQMESLGY